MWIRPDSGKCQAEMELSNRSLCEGFHGERDNERGGDDSKAAATEYFTAALAEPACSPLKGCLMSEPSATQFCVL